MQKISKNIRIHVLNSSLKLSSWENEIYKITKNHLEIIKTKIPISDIDIVFYDDAKATIKGKGIGGSSRGSHTVFVYLDSDFKKLDAVINKEIPRTLAHELHHIVRLREVGYRKTLLDGLVAEGLAGHFEIQLFGGKPRPWNNALKKKELRKLSKLAETHFLEPYNPLKWFYGKTDKTIPKWAGYTIGFELVASYLKSYPNKKASDLYKTESKKFIEK